MLKNMNIFFNMPKVSANFTTTSGRVKSVDFHPDQKLVLLALYSGDVQVWNYEEKALVKEVKLSEKPVRCAKFFDSDLIAAATDEGNIHILSLHQLPTILHTIPAHTDFIRSLAIHPTLPYLISASDDKFIKVWDQSNDWNLEQEFHGHENYIMQVVVNSDTIISASLDGSVKGWKLGEEKAVWSLETLQERVNCVEIDGKGRMVTGSDDTTLKVWDLESKTCTKTINAHSHNVTTLCSFDNLLISGSEDNTLKFWDLESDDVLQDTVDLGKQRVWSICKGDGLLAVAMDEGAAVLSID